MNSPTIPYSSPPHKHSHTNTGTHTNIHMSRKKTLEERSWALWKTEKAEDILKGEQRRKESLANL